MTKHSVCKKATRVSAAQRRVQKLITCLRSLNHPTGDEGWTNVVAACQDARRLTTARRRKDRE